MGGNSFVFLGNHGKFSDAKDTNVEWKIQSACQPVVLLPFPLRKMKRFKHTCYTKCKHFSRSMGRESTREPQIFNDSGWHFSFSPAIAFIIYATRVY